MDKEPDMDKIAILKKRLDEIGASLEKSEHGLALLALGSCGLEQERMDQYSDLDFFVIVQDGYKQRYLEQLDWLEEVAPVVFRFQNTADGYKALFEDDIFCEFAVFEVRELEMIPYTKGRIVWKETDFDESLCEPQKEIAKVQKSEDIDWMIGEALTNLYIGLGRYHRGEKLSAFHFVQNYAVGRVLDIISLQESVDCQFIDVFDQSRRFEQRYPEMAEVLPIFLQGYDRTPESAAAILNYLDAQYQINSAIKERIERLLAVWKE